MTTLPLNIRELFPYEKLRPCQEKALNAGVLEKNNVLVCSPTASGKTQVAEFGILHYFFNKLGKTVYVVPLKALASEKFKNFKTAYEKIGLRVGISIGDLDSDDS